MSATKKTSSITSFFQPKKAKTKIDDVLSAAESSSSPSKKSRVENAVDASASASAIVTASAEEQKEKETTEKAVGKGEKENVVSCASTTTSTQGPGGEIEKTGWAPFDNMEPSWRRELVKEVRKPYFQKLLKFLEGEVRTQTVFPCAAEVFTAFNLCPLDSIKVVVIGQDPYHGPGQAHGLAFSVKRGVAVPPSLRNMIKECVDDPNVNTAATISGHGDLSCWAKQGVLMLNVCLTVRKAQANSHQKQGWEQFTDAVVQILAKKERHCVLAVGNAGTIKVQNHKQESKYDFSHYAPLTPLCVQRLLWVSVFLSV